MVKVSVIVPVYNNEEYLDKCLSSLIGQSLEDIEIICVNDGSGDSSLDILNKYKQKDNRIVVLSQENQGAGASRNNGIDIANGEYISFVDADDWLEENALKKLYENAVRNNSDVVLFNSVERWPDSQTKERIYIPPNDETDYDNLVFDYNYSKNLVMNAMFVVWSKIYKTSFIKENNIRFDTYKIFNDVQFHVESMLLSERMSYVPDILYNYNKLNESSLQTSKSNSNKRILVFDVFDGVENFLKQHNLFDEFYTNFVQFKITESKANLERTSDEFKQEFYSLVRKEFIRMNVDIETLEEIPDRYYSFYIHVLNCYTYEAYERYVFEVSKCRENFVNRKYENEQMAKFNELGINPERDENSIIVSLTSFPERMEDIHYCLYSLLYQTLKPHKVILWLAESQFPNKEDDLPHEVLNLKKNGLTIEWCKDIRSYKKLIPALKKYPDYYIVTADDDIFYPKTWLEEIWKAHEESPNTIIASRVRRITLENKAVGEYSHWKILKRGNDASFLNFPTNGAGSLFSPGMLSKIVFDEELFLNLAPNGDDIWFWAMMVLNNVKIKPIEKPMYFLKYVNIAREVGIINEYKLWDSNEAGYNDVQINNVLKHFPEIITVLYM